MDTDKDYYAVLGLSPRASQQEIKTKYKKLCLKHHPDKNPGQEEDANRRFQALHQAYKVLSDASRTSGSNPDSSVGKGNPWCNMRSYQTPLRQNQANPGTVPNGAKNGRFPADVPPRNEARPATKTGGGRPAPPPPPPRRKFAQKRAEASFGSRKNGSYPRTDVRDEPPAESSNYRSPHTSSPNASNPNPDTSAQAPPPVPQRPSPTAKTDPPDIVNPHTMDKDNTPPTTSTPPHQPPEFPFPQPAQTTSSPKRSQQPAESKQSTGTIPMPPAPQNTNDESTRPESHSANVETPSANENRPVNPKTPFDLDKEGSGGGREFPTPPTAPQIPASIDGVQPSVSDSET